MFRSAFACGCLLVACGASPAPPTAAVVAVRPSVVKAPRVAPAMSGSAAGDTTAAPSVAVAAPTAAGASVDAPQAAPPAFVVRYPCDDKYDAEHECRPGKPAWNAWLGGVQLGDASNILAHRAGGPGGAEWNPNAPLIAFLASAPPGRARLKTSRATFTPIARFGEYDVFLVPIKAWEAATRGSREGDIEDSPVIDAISSVDLRAFDAQGKLTTGVFAYSRGE